MIKLFLLTINLLLFSAGIINSQIETSPQNEPNSPKIERALEAIKSIPEGARLLKEIEKEGPFRVEIRAIDSFDFGAMWDSGNRSIVVNAARCHNDGIFISSLLFELHNARSTRYLEGEANKAVKGALSKEEYVATIERMEHSNALATIKILEQGIEKGIFPVTAKWTVIENFDDHYKLQQVSGHSVWIADHFDAMSPRAFKAYQGTIENFQHLTDEDKQKIAYYLSVKNKIATGSEKEIAFATKYLMSEIASVIDGELYPFLKDSHSHEKHKYRLNAVFEGHSLYEEHTKKIRLLPIDLYAQQL